MLKFQDDYTTLIATFEDFIFWFLQWSMIYISSLFLRLFRKGEMSLLQKCLIPKLLP